MTFTGLIAATTIAGCGAGPKRTSSSTERDEAPPMTAGARCDLAGKGRLHAPLYAAPSGAELIAEVDGEVLLEIDTLFLAGRTRTPVRVRTEPEAPGFQLRGWLEAQDLPLQMRRSLDVVPGHVRINANAPVLVTAGHGSRIEVWTDDACLSAFVVSAETDCSVIALSFDAPGTKPFDRGPGTLHHARRDRLSLFDDDGRRVYVLSSPPSITFSVVERKGSMSRVIHDEFVTISGWVPTAEIAPGQRAGFHCNFLRDSRDICFGQPRFGDECKNRGEKLVEVARPALVRAGPSADARVVGEVQAGARVYLVRSQGEFDQIAPPNGAFIAPKGSGFWVASAELVPALGRR